MWWFCESPISYTLKEFLYIAMIWIAIDFSGQKLVLGKANFPRYDIKFPDEIFEVIVGSPPNKAAEFSRAERNMGFSLNLVRGRCGQIKEVKYLTESLTFRLSCKRGFKWGLLLD